MLMTPAEAEERQYDVAHAPPTPQAGKAALVNQPSGMGVSKPRRVLRYEGKPQDAEIDDYFPDKFKDLYLPITLLSIGVLVEFLARWWSGSWIGMGPGEALRDVGVVLIISTSLMLLGIWIAAKMRGISFGPAWTAVLKLSDRKSAR